MKIKIKKRVLSESLERLSKALNDASAYKNLRGIMVEVKSNTMDLTASNGNLAIKDVITIDDGVEILSSGKFLVPGRLFKEVIFKQSEDIEIKKDNNALEINSFNSKVIINLLNLEDYPVIDFTKPEKRITISLREMKKLIKNVSYASADNDKRIILNGVNIVCINKKIKAFATDSFRLAKGEINVDSDIEFNFIVYSKNIRDFLPQTILGDIEISVGDTKIVTTHKQSTIVSRLIDGVYPEVEKFIPNTFKTEITIFKRELLGILERAIVVSNEDVKVVKMSASKEELSFEAKRSEVATSKVKTENFNFKGEEISITFNASFLREAVEKCEEEIMIKLNGKFKPIIITNTNDNKFLHFILPHKTL